MSRIEHINLADRLEPEPDEAISVTEGKFAVANPQSDHEYLMTRGLFTCKGIVIHDPHNRETLIGHLGSTVNLQADIESMVEAFPGEIEQSDISLVRSVQTLRDGWPTIWSMARLFLDYNPRSLQIDKNYREKTTVRGIAFNLRTDSLAEIDSSKGWLLGSGHDA